MGLNADVRYDHDLRSRRSEERRETANRLGRNGRVQWKLYNIATAPPSFSQSFRETLFASSVSERHCGPLRKVFKSIAPVERLSGATTNWLLIATLINCPLSDIWRGITPRKPVILPVGSWYTSEGRDSSYQEFRKKISSK